MEDEINSQSDDKAHIPLLSSVSDVEIKDYHPNKEHIGPVLCWKNPPNKVRKCWSKVNSKTVATGVILGFLLVAAIIFSVSKEEQIENLHLMAVSSDFPLVIKNHNQLHKLITKNP